MKWGVRKDHGHEGERARTSKITKLDKKFTKNAGSARLAINTYNKAGRKYANEDISRINNKPQYKNKDFSKDSPLRQKYYKEHQQAFVNQLEKQVSSLGTNASGTQKYTIHEKPNGSWDIVSVNVKHDDEIVNVEVHYDSNGMITGVDIPDSMQQSVNLEDFLSHHGIKGMKWGVRKGPSGSPSSDSKSSAPTHASGDHIQAESHKHTVGKHGLKALSNNDLKQLNERMQLEQTYRDLQNKKPSKFDTGHKQVKKILGVGNTINGVYNMANSPAGKAARAAYKTRTAGKTAYKVYKITKSDD